MTQKRLCVVGDYAWDVLIEADSHLLTGGDSYGRIALAPGGSAANVAVWACRSGAEVDFVGKIGRDRFGRLAADDLADEGVAAHLACSDTHATGTVAAFVNADGERSMVSGMGADHYLEPEDLPAEVIGSCGHLHLTGWSLFTEPPRTAAVESARLAHEGGATVSFDPSSFQLVADFGVDRFVAMTADLGIDVVLPNLEEGRVITGRREPEEVARTLAGLYPEAIIVLKLDADGALIWVDGSLVGIDPVPADPVDTTGAGDSFAGAFLAHWLAGADPAEAGRLAARVAAWVVERPGARPPLDDELSEYLARIHRDAPSHDRRRRGSKENR